MSTDIALLLLRVVVGGYVLAHGAHDVFGWFTAAGPSSVKTMRQAGLTPPKLWAGVLGVTEVAGGLLLMLGLLSPLGSISVAGAMLLLTLGVSLRRGLFDFTGGVELPITNLGVAVAIAIAGPGGYSIDALLHISIRERGIAIAAVVVTWLVVVIALNSFRAGIDWSRTE